MLSFAKLWENILDHMGNDEHESLSMKAIRTGINIRDGFWDDFLLVLNNREAMSELLGVTTEQISSWAVIIKDNLAKIEDADQIDDKEVRTKVLDTGDVHRHP